MIGDGVAFSAAGASSPFSSGPGHQRPLFVHLSRSIAASAGSVSETVFWAKMKIYEKKYQPTWRRGISCVSKHFCHASGSDSKTSWGSRPPGEAAIRFAFSSFSCSSIHASILAWARPLTRPRKASSSSSKAFWRFSEEKISVLMLTWYSGLSFFRYLSKNCLKQPRGSILTITVSFGRAKMRSTCEFLRAQE